MERKKGSAPLGCSPYLLCAIINLASDGKEIYFSSNLEIAPEILLSAPESVPWTETWILDASPIWHCDLSGIPVIHHQDEQGHWRPEWKPWPGENVIVNISRPKPVPGKMVTIDSANLILIPGTRFTKAELIIKIRTSRGGQQQILLPDGAKLQLVKIDSKSQPVKQDGQKVVVPLHPGNQKIYLQWRQLTKSTVLLKCPIVNIGNKAVNAKVTFNMPRNRWILWTAGPRLGPAVLFWSYLLVVIMAAFILGRISLTPLKTFQWLLLGLGLTQVPPWTAIMIVGWLFALGFRKKHIPPDNWFFFNGIQLILGVWTLSALYGLYIAIEQGLLGIPDMQISGNNSNNFHLHWTQDRIDSILPRPYVLSLPQLCYHILMLCWAIWLAFALSRSSKCRKGYIQIGIHVA